MAQQYIGTGRIGTSGNVGLYGHCWDLQPDRNGNMEGPRACHDGRMGHDGRINPELDRRGLCPCAFA